MKKTIALTFALLLNTIASPVLQASQSFGPTFDFSKSAPVTVAQVLATPASYLQQPFTVQGKIDAVCQKKGCWMQFATGADEPTFRLKVKDGDMEFPVSAKGKTAYAYGSLKAKPMTLEQTKTYLKHRAEEQGEAFDAAKVTSAVTLYQFEPVSVLIE
ncbi:MAG: DUF4920 domain-containing protein [Rheinheimera sp.]|nr:MAG: DUF4920 domain-containing protein [Rheinheimera sp.]